MKTWFITGCSTGLGRALATAVLAQGDNAVVTARNMGAVTDIVADYPHSALALALDVTKVSQIEGAISDAERRFGAVDVLVNNAAFIFNGAVEETQRVEISRLFETNFFGPRELIRAALPGMRSRGTGHIINVSSMAAIMPIPGFGLYAASKAALTALSDTLAEEVKPFGIHVSVVELGGHVTRGSANMVYPSSPIDAYMPSVGAVRARVSEHSGQEMGDANLAASALIELAAAETPPRIIPLGKDATERKYAMWETQRRETDQWRALSESTVRSDYAGQQAA